MWTWKVHILFTGPEINFFVTVPAGTWTKKLSCQFVWSPKFETWMLLHTNNFPVTAAVLLAIVWCITWSSYCAHSMEHNPLDLNKLLYLNTFFFNAYLFLSKSLRCGESIFKHIFFMLRFIILKNYFVSKSGSQHRGAELVCQRMFLELMT